MTLTENDAMDVICGELECIPVVGLKNRKRMVYVITALRTLKETKVFQSGRYEKMSDIKASMKSRKTRRLLKVPLGRPRKDEK